MAEEVDRRKSDGGSRISALHVAVADAARRATHFLYDQKPLATDRFIVLPSLGRLIPRTVLASKLMAILNEQMLRQFLAQFRKVTQHGTHVNP